MFFWLIFFKLFCFHNNFSCKSKTISCNFSIPVFPTSSPYITSVGGTQWQGFFAPDAKRPEAWPGSGGGFSWEFPMPKHQQKSVQAYLTSMSSQPDFPPHGSFNETGRAYPDIAAVGVEGTSQSSPIMAGIFSLLIDLRLQQGLKPLGFVAPRVWQVNEQYPEEAFQSVEKGNSKTACPTGFPASKKWSKFFWRFWFVSCFCCCFTDIPCLRSCCRVGPTTVPGHDRALLKGFGFLIFLNFFKFF